MPGFYKGGFIFWHVLEHFFRENGSSALKVKNTIFRLFPTGLADWLIGLWNLKDILNSHQYCFKKKLVGENALTRVHAWKISVRYKIKTK